MAQRHQTMMAPVLFARYCQNGPLAQSWPPGSGTKGWEHLGRTFLLDDGEGCTRKHLSFSPPLCDPKPNPLAKWDHMKLPEYVPPMLVLMFADSGIPIWKALPIFSHLLIIIIYPSANSQFLTLRWFTKGMRGGGRESITAGVQGEG